MMEVVVVAGFCLAGWLSFLWVLNRGLKLYERRMERMDDKVDAAEGMPTDVLALALSESEPWATADVLKSYQELRMELGSWDAVRNAIAYTRGPADDLTNH